MARPFRWIGAVLTSAVLCTTATAQQTDLINRSFENGTDPGDMTTLAPGSTAIASWTIVGGSVWYVGGRWKHFQGVRSVGLPCGGGISQAFATEPDQSYEVRFNMAGDPTSGPPVKTVTLTFGTETRAFTFDTTGRSAGDMGWEARFWMFKATEPSTTLSFMSPKSGCSTPAIDNVRITPVEIGV
jgi:choice-of-anchor C domain-containing protein